MVQSSFSAYRSTYRSAYRFAPRHVLSAIASAHKVEAATKRADSALATLSTLA